jgi:hypothetical protein
LYVLCYFEFRARARYCHFGLISWTLVTVLSSQSAHLWDLFGVEGCWWDRWMESTTDHY